MQKIEGSMLRDKFKAFAVHLSLSALVGLVCAFIIYKVWFIAPLEIATKITPIFLMMVGIDIIVGPLLTFLVYKKGKKTLKLDLSVIVIIQCIALIYGVFNIYQSRPLWIAFDQDSFYLVRANEVDLESEKKAAVAYQSRIVSKPQFVSIKRPDIETQKGKELRFYDFMGMNLAVKKPELYDSMNSARQALSTQAFALQDLEKYNANTSLILSKYPQADAFLPLKTNVIDMTVLINKEKGEVVKIVDLRPGK
ncbi:TfpX/TfpZ family type IV pilin accessory protein [Acinetobacter gyllenbergii]|uniref:TfpX/TfpZ family type IV pilin accessory protein n=1 Tax=Acinetobacter gyllenbergii TaxID=134534 RepID=UPI0021D39445|nr:TfpX/TfpZ family type IV pilin accessory protein [Acinetobacter gyllenbergii]